MALTCVGSNSRRNCGDHLAAQGDDQWDHSQPRSLNVPLPARALDQRDCDRVASSASTTRGCTLSFAIGSIEGPMTDKQLEGKFGDLADGVIPASAIRPVMDACWNVESLIKRRRDRENVRFGLTALGAPARPSFDKRAPSVDARRAATPADRRRWGSRSWRNSSSIPPSDPTTSGRGRTRAGQWTPESRTP